MKKFLHILFLSCITAFSGDIENRKLDEVVKIAEKIFVAELTSVNYTRTPIKKFGMEGELTTGQFKMKILRQLKGKTPTTMKVRYKLENGIRSITVPYSGLEENFKKGEKYVFLIKVYKKDNLLFRAEKLSKEKEISKLIKEK